jgi:hypothetical protein
MRRLALVALAAAALLAAILPAAAMARGKDSNRDRIPDRWERTHGLSLKVKQAKRDQDRDGMRNLAEYRNGTDPRDADSDDDGLKDGRELRHGNDPTDDDSDDDGVEDGDENSGKIDSFDPTTKVLTISLAKGGTISALVTDRTELDCESAKPVATSSHSDDDEGDDDHSGPGGGDHGDDDGDREDGGHEHGDDDDDHGDDEDDDDERDSCPADALKAGTVVHEAELSIRNGEAVWRQLELRI